MIKFRVVSSYENDLENNYVYLALEKWNDWFTYQTLYRINYKDKDGNRRDLGFVKIGQKSQGRSPDLPDDFTELSSDYFSVGSDRDYYEALKKLDLNGSKRKEILKALRDIAFDLEHFKNVKDYDVVQSSLLRNYSANMIENQLHRVAQGGAWLTKYYFEYTLPKQTHVLEDRETVLNFEIEPEELPPSNIHVLIGKNGVGKTTILKNMLYSLESRNEDYGKIKFKKLQRFSNVLYVSFSFFDEFIEIEEGKIPYFYIGLIKEKNIKKLDDLSREFADSLFEVISSNKNKLWEDTISILESDLTFVDLNIRNWSEQVEIPYAPRRLKTKDGEVIRLGAHRRQIQKNKFIKLIAPKFKDLSSGHKVILLIIARLIDKVEEKTLVLLDEPEEHLHPPLVSAFIRALSNLLIHRNGVGLIATHSPVIVQEVPRKCVWILRRTGDEIVAERPLNETFGENLGILTSDIFGYEVTESGFHSMIRDIAKEKSTYKQALKSFDGQLGNEGKTILRSLMFEKESSEEEINDKN